MEVKKKLNIYFQRYGMLLKMAISSMLVFASLVIFCRTSQAYMSDEYLYYVNQTLAENASGLQAQQINGYLLNDRDGRTSILNILNNQFDTWNIPNIDDSNILVFSNSASDSYKTMLKIIVCNNSVPGEYTDLDFFKISSNRIYKYTNDNSPIYQANITLQADIYQKVTVSNQVFYKWDLSDNSASFQFGNTNFSGDSILRIQNLACCGIPQGFCYKPLNSSTIVPIILEDYNGNYHPVTLDPEPTPSGDTPTVPTGTITNNSGEKTGQIDLSGIETGITNINQSIQNQNEVMNQNTQTIVNTLSGETQKITNTLTESADETIDNTAITSGDIANTVDFSLIDNNQQYTAITNFWYELLNSFSDAITNVNRSITVEFRGQFFNINLDQFTLNVPAVLKLFLSSFTTAVVVIYISKNIKHVIEDIQTASIDNVANKLTEDFETNLF